MRSKLGKLFKRDKIKSGNKKYINHSKYQCAQIDSRKIPQRTMLLKANRNYYKNGEENRRVGQIDQLHKIGGMAEKQVSDCEIRTHRQIS